MYNTVYQQHTLATFRSFVSVSFQLPIFYLIFVLKTLISPPDLVDFYTQFRCIHHGN